MAMFTEVADNVYRLTIPFEDIYTTVFAVKADDKWVLFDTATYDSDVKNYILPALEELSAVPDIIFLSHAHRDHAGGLDVLLERYPFCTVMSRNASISERFCNKVYSPADGEEIASGHKAIHIPGHSRDSMGLYDSRNGILLSGDCLQVDGIFGRGKWGANITAPAAHIKAIAGLRSMGIQKVFAAHDYSPLGWRADGEEAVEAYLSACEQAIYNMRDFVMSYIQLDDEPIAEMYNSTSGKPTVGTHVFAAVRSDFC